MKNKLFVLITLTAVIISNIFGSTPITSHAEESLIDLSEYTDYESFAINDSDDLITLANMCKEDSASYHLLVTLENDVNLDEDFDGVPYFNGVFNGNGYTISGLDITGRSEATGLFLLTGPNAIIANLNVSANIIPSGSASYVGVIAGSNQGTIALCQANAVVVGDTYVGGIAGSNESTGLIFNCTMDGAVRGSTYVGGIVGVNSGQITGCVNNSMVNTEAIDYSIDVTTIDIDIAADIANLNTDAMALSAMDIGGICGYNSGNILSSTNNSTVGYIHTGYNIGGIAGRTTGFVYGCTNNSYVYGRKDVGGIAGQMEPYVDVSLSASELKQLKSEANQLEGLMSQLNTDALEGDSQVTSSIDNINTYIDSIEAGADSLEKSATDKVDSITQSTVDNAVNKVGDTVDDTINKVGYTIDNAVSDAIDDVTDAVNDATDKINELSNTTPESILEDITSNSEDTVEDVTNTIEETAENATDSSTNYSPSVSRSEISQDIYSSYNNARASTKKAIEESELKSNVDGLESELKVLNSQLSELNNTMVSDLTAISDKFSDITSIIKKTGNSDAVSDTSDINPSIATAGAVRACTNEGTVDGDVNTGGIAGSMGIESSIDPEDDIALDIDSDTRKTYEYITVLYGCQNVGDINSLRNYTGGITGRADIGYVSNCESYGNINATSNYVGGIAGKSAITINSCYAKLHMTGDSYVGGIIGCGTDESTSGDTSLVSNCRTIVAIDDASQFFGAISGYNSGNYTNNYYCSETLGGIGNVSYENKAALVDYETLISDDNLPDDFTTLKVRFMAEDTLISEITFDYGDSIPLSDFPDIPQKNNCFAHWDKTELNNLTIDTTVNAVYTTYISSLDTDVQRTNGRCAFYVEGNFSDDQALSVDKLDTDIDYDFKGDILEIWELTIPDDGDDTHTVRFLPSTDDSDLILYVANGDGWSEIENGQIGNYLTFDVTGDNVKIAVVQPSHIILIILIVWLLLVWLIAIIVVGLKMRKKYLSEKHVKKPEVVYASEEERIANERIDKMGHVMRHGIRVARVLTGIGVAIAIVVISIIIIMPSKVSGLIAGFYLSRLVADDDLQTNIQIDVTGAIDRDENLSLYRIATDDGTFTKLEIEGLDLYLKDDAMYLETGAGFEISSLIPDYNDAIATLPDLFKSTDVTTTRSNGTYYTINVDSDECMTLLEKTYPTIKDYGASISQVEISIYTSDFAVNKIDMNFDLNVDGNIIDASVVMDIVDDEDKQTVSVPDTVLTAINDENALAKITDDEIRLLLSFGSLMAKDPCSGSITLSGSYGSFSISDSLSWYRAKQNGKWINSISKNGVSIYYTDTGACTASGVALTESQQNSVDIGRFVDLAYTLCQSGSLTYSSEDDYESFVVDLDSDTILELAGEIAPDIDADSLNLKNGTLEIDMADGNITSISVTITGKVKILFLSEDITLGISFKPSASSPDFDLPSAVTETLLGK